jgi:hypothetical protein
MDFVELDAEIGRLTRCVRVCQESPAFADLATALADQLSTMLTPLVCLLCLTDGPDREAVAARYNALLALLPSRPLADSW